MPTPILNARDIQPVDIYEDSAYHPCLCLGVDDYGVWGVSLIDGSYPRAEDFSFSGIRKLSPQEAWLWKTQGPAIDSETDLRQRSAHAE